MLFSTALEVPAGARCPGLPDLEWQKAWWDSFGRGQLLLVAARRAGEVRAVAPWFADRGRVFFVGSVDDPSVLPSLLEGVRARVPGIVGFRFHHLSKSSSTGDRLSAVAPQFSLVCFDEGELPAPALELNGDGEAVCEAARTKSLLRHEWYFRRIGGLEVEHSREGSAILPRLDESFESRFATRVNCVHTWGIYPKEAVS